MESKLAGKNKEDSDEIKYFGIFNFRVLWNFMISSATSCGSCMVCISIRKTWVAFLKLWFSYEIELFLSTWRGVATRYLPISCPMARRKIIDDEHNANCLCLWAYVFCIVSYFTLFSFSVHVGEGCVLSCLITAMIITQQTKQIEKCMM